MPPTYFADESELRSDHAAVIRDADEPVVEATNGALKLFALPAATHNAIPTNGWGRTSNLTVSNLQN